MGLSLIFLQLDFFKPKDTLLEHLSNCLLSLFVQIQQNVCFFNYYPITLFTFFCLVWCQISICGTISIRYGSLKVKKEELAGKECWIVCFRGNSSHVWTRVSAAKFPREDDVKARLHSSCCSTAPELSNHWHTGSNVSNSKVKGFFVYSHHNPACRKYHF